MKKFIVGFALAAGLVSGFTAGFQPTDACALPDSEVEKYYYSDATFTEQIGYRWLTCYGHLSSWGTTSRYKFEWSETCSGGVGTGPYCYVCTGADYQCYTVVCPTDMQ